MEDRTILALLACDDEAIRDWFRDAIEADWNDLDGIADAAMQVHGELHGFWRCNHCDSPVLDDAVASHAGADGGANLLGSACDSIILCEECYEAAKAARAKIKIVTTEGGGEEEDDSALTDEERGFAGYLDRAIEAQLREARTLITDHPRDERRDLHRYQDQIDRDARRAGKSADQRD